MLINAQSEVWPLKEAFTISRGSKTSAHVVVVTIRDGQHAGRGESVPYTRYGETIEGVLDDIRAVAPLLRSRNDAQGIMKPGAARNAVDCAFWDLEAKRSGRRTAEMFGMGAIGPAMTAYTLSLDTPEAMAAKALSVPAMPLLKLKLGGDGDAQRMRAVRHALPDARLIVDANEAWRADQLSAFVDAAAACGVEVIEQPLPAGNDDALIGFPRTVPICADESLHVAADLAELAGRYDAVNVKLDKAGGLTEATAVVREARRLGYKVMIGSMVGTSLAVAPAMMLAQSADWTDLDGPLLLANDRPGGLRFEGARVYPPEPALWG